MGKLIPCTDALLILCCRNENKLWDDCLGKESSELQKNAGEY